MKKILAVFLAVLALTASFTALAFAANEVTADYWFIEQAGGKTSPKNAEFTVPGGKTVQSLMMDGKTIVQGDGVTPWVSNMTNADKNWEYDADSGKFTISARFICSEADVFDKGERSFTLTFTDKTSVNLKIIGKSTWFKFGDYVKTTPADWANDKIYGYKNTEIKPDNAWSMTASSSFGALGASWIDGAKNEGHSWYLHNGNFVYRYEVPHYVVIDTGKNTEISGVRYVPRSSNRAGSWTDVTYQGSNDGVNWTEIDNCTYAGTFEDSTSEFGKNVSYRYYRAKVEGAVSGYCTGDEIHFIKPVAAKGTVSADISSSKGAVVALDRTPGKVLSVTCDNSALTTSDYSLSGSSLSLSANFVSSLTLGKHKLSVAFENCMADVTLEVRDNTESLNSAKTAAKAELAALGASNLDAEVDKFTDASELYTFLDNKAREMGAEFVDLKYNEKKELVGASVLNQSINDEGTIAKDKSVVTVTGTIVKATGLGRAIISASGKKYLIKTSKADLALVLITGQSNAAGDSSDYLKTPSAVGEYEDRYYITNTLDTNRELDKITMEDASFAAKNGGRPNIGENDYSWNRGGTLNSAAAASQMGARLSDEWNMPVWVVNTGVCGQIIERFDPKQSGSTTYTKTVNYMNKVRSLIEDDGHFVIDETKTGMFWLQGESDGIDTNSQNTMVEYRTMFMNMYNGLKKDVGINYCGIWLVRAGINGNVAKDFEMSGPRLAQIFMGNSGADAYKNIYLILNTDIWRTDVGVKEYFEERHSDAAAFKAYYGYDRPTTLSEIKPGLHHSQKGYNELGDEAAYVISKIFKGSTDKVTDAYIASFSGDEAESFTIKAGESTLAVPIVATPYYNASANLTVKISDTSIAEYDGDSFEIRGLKQGTTEAVLYSGAERIASYPITVDAAQVIVTDPVLSNRTAWTVNASSEVGTSRGARMLLDSNTATNWTADLSQKVTESAPQYFEITLPEKAWISGFSFSSYDDPNGFPLKYEIYVDTGSGSYKSVKSDTFSQSAFVKHEKYDIVFDKNYNVKRVKFAFLSSVNGYAAMSEAYLIGKNAVLSDDEVYSSLDDRTGWIVTASSEWTDAKRYVNNLIDGNTTTSWTADINQKVTESAPQYFEITLPQKETVSAFSFVSFNDNNGFPFKYEIHIDAGNGTYEKIKSGTYVLDDWVKNKKYDIEFDKNYEIKRLKFVFLSSVNGYAAMNEIYLTGEKKETPVNAKISITKAESGVYSDKTGVVRFITKIDALDKKEVEYYGTYAVETTNFDENSVSLLNKVTVEGNKKVPTEGDTWALDVHTISEDNFSKSITAVSFVKLKGVDEPIYSEAFSNKSIDKTKNHGKNPYAQSVKNTVKITESNVKINGRYIVDYETGKIKTSHSASGVEANFTGTEISIKLNADRDAYIYAYVDDNIEFTGDINDDRRIFVKAGDNEIKIAENLKEGTHRVTVAKANEGCDNVIAWDSFVTDGEIIASPAAKARKIQIVGDSITAGASTLDSSGGYSDPAIVYNDGMRSYAPTLARALNADFEVFAQRGLSMSVCMNANPYQYEKINPYAANADGEFNKSWDHSIFEPDLIIQCNWWNETYKMDTALSDKKNNGKTAAEAEAEVKKEFTELYVKVITMLKDAHPDAKVMLVCGDERPLFIEILNAAITEYGKTYDDASDVTVMTYSRAALENGRYVHPSPQGHIDMAEQFIPQIKSFMGWK